MSKESEITLFIARLGLIIHEWDGSKEQMLTFPITEPFFELRE